jgi:transcriptional regulator with XRE-family HTH domain
MSTTDLWTESGHDWHRPVVLPTLRVAPRYYGSRVGGVIPDSQRKERLAFAIRAAMGKRTAQDVAAVIQPKRSKETIARWARGDTVPSALDVGPLAAALGVKIDLLINPPDVPTYPLADYLVNAAVSEGLEEGLERARRPREDEAPSRPRPMPGPRARAAGRG